MEVPVGSGGADIRLVYFISQGSEDSERGGGNGPVCS